MDARHWVILAIANVALVGCRYHDPSIDLLESELRWMEDQMYLLEDEVQLKSRQLELCKNGQVSPSPRDSAPTGRNRLFQKFDPNSEILPPGEDDPSLLEAPRIELPSPSDDAGPSPTPAGSPSRATTDQQDPGSGFGGGSGFGVDSGSGDDSGFDRELRIPLDGQGAPPILESPSAQATPFDPLIVQQSFESPLEPEELDPYVTHLVVHSQMSGGFNFDGRPGIDGLLVVVEPRNADARYVPLSGAVSVVALDANQAGPAARIGRWDFDATEVGRNLRKSPLGRGVHLELPWPDAPPETDQLHVFVRYVTADGRKLQADQQADGDVSHPTIRGWTPANRERRTATSAVPPKFQESPAPDSLPATAQSVLAATRQLEESVAAIEHTLSTSAVPRQLTPPAVARPLRPSGENSPQAIPRPQWHPER